LFLHPARRARRDGLSRPDLGRCGPIRSGESNLTKNKGVSAMTFARFLTAGTFALALSATTAFTGGALAKDDVTLDLVEPLAQYKIYVAENTAKLVKDTREFVAAIKAGDVEKAKKL